jgi:hypothetical protein
MPDYSGALKKFRDSGYPKPKAGDEGDQGDAPSADATAAPSVRVIKLTDDEAKELQSYQDSPGAEQVCQVTGKLDGTTFRVMSVSALDAEMEPDMDVSPDEAGLGDAQMVQSQTMPSPS